MHRIILASQSPRRREILRQIGIEAEIIPSALEEERDTDDPEELVRKLSFQKAADVAARVKGEALVIAADTVVHLEGKILGKPGDHREAGEMLRKLSGKTHYVYTGVSLILLPEDGAENQKLPLSERAGVKKLGFTERTEVSICRLTEEEIRDYAESEEPMDKAGAYGIQGVFSRYVRGINGDFYNVMGLPASHLYHMMKRIEQL